MRDRDGPSRSQELQRRSPRELEPSFAGSPTDVTVAPPFDTPAEVLDQARPDALAEDRARIARDLHDRVIQRLFVTGLGLQAIADSAGSRDPEVLTGAITEQVGQLDVAIADIRSIIFALTAPLPMGPSSIRDALGEILHESEPLFTEPPSLAFRGDPDREILHPLLEDLTAVTREGLANAGKHAVATTVEVMLCATPDELVLEILDDGVGFVPSGRSSGIANLAERARRRGGTFTLSARPSGGTALEWRIPLPPAGAR